MNELAALAALLGAALIVLADGRQALALGLAVSATGFAVLAWPAGGWIAVGAVLAGGAIGAATRYGKGAPGWGVMPAGSTPRVILVVVAALIALWFAASVTSGDGWPFRFATMVVVALMAARVLTASAPSVILTSIAVLALGLAVIAGPATSGPGPAPYMAAALIAGAVSFLRLPEPHGA